MSWLPVLLEQGLGQESGQVVFGGVDHVAPERCMLLQVVHAVEPDEPAGGGSRACLAPPSPARHQGGATRC